MNSRIVVVNTGASSLKLALVDCTEGGMRTVRSVEREWGAEADVGSALREGLASLDASPDAFGHRFVHGGAAFVEPVTVTAEVDAALETLQPLAPLHNGVALAAIRAVRADYPAVPSVAVFDTAFHAQRRPESMRYALPGELVERFQFRRYGFHGFAHASLVDAVAEARGVHADEVSAVTLQLGAGCSACAVRHGRSVETSMGFTPLDGLVMTSRSGSIDAAIVLALMRAGFGADEIEDELTRRSGLRALTGSTDMREILDAAHSGRADASLALDLFCQRVVLTVGAYLTLLDGDGAIVFGGGIGTNAPAIRERIARGLAAWDVRLDDVRNAANEPGRISVDDARAVYVFRSNEEAVIARAVASHLAEQPTEASP
jgi:acetate kinase